MTLTIVAAHQTRDATGVVTAVRLHLRAEDGTGGNLDRTYYLLSPEITDDLSPILQRELAALAGDFQQILVPPTVEDVAAQYTITADPAATTISLKRDATVKPTVVGALDALP